METFPQQLNIWHTRGSETEKHFLLWPKTTVPYVPLCTVDQSNRARVRQTRRDARRRPVNPIFSFLLIFHSLRTELVNGTLFSGDFFFRARVADTCILAIYIFQPVAAKIPNILLRN